MTGVARRSGARGSGDLTALVASESRMARGRGRSGCEEETKGAELSAADLFTSHRARIRRYILHMVHDPAEADDLTQDVFLQAHRRLGSLRDPDAAVSWLYRIATHVCYDRFRQWSHRPRPAAFDVARPGRARPATLGADEPMLDQVIEQSDMSACVRGYLDDLAHEYRTVILLHDMEGLTNPEIAEMLGISLEVVKIRVHRARRKLQAVLGAHCVFTRDDRGVFVCEPAPTSTSSS